MATDQKYSEVILNSLTLNLADQKKMGLVIKVLYSSRSYKNVINKSTMCLEHENKFRQWTLMAKSCIYWVFNYHVVDWVKF